MFGASLVDACAGAGFASVDKFTASCKGAAFFESLQAARARAVNALPSVGGGLLELNCADSR